jgi:hypothetical protein
MLKYCAAGATMLFLALDAESAGAAGLIQNGSFEAPLVPAGSYTTFNTGDKFKGWTVVGATGNVAEVNDTFTYCGHTFPARKGHQFLDLTGTTNTPTGVRQTVATIAGATYSLSFAIGNVYDLSSNCGTTSTVNLSIDGNPVASFTNKAGKTSTAIEWKKYSIEFVAAGATTNIAFFNGDPASETANGLDAVTLQMVSP